MLATLLSSAVAVSVVELAVRVVSSYGRPLFDVEMWRYAKQVKIESLWSGIVEEHRPNVDAMLMNVRIRTDDRRFRKPDPHTEIQRASTDRTVVVIGDSLTLGWGVAEGQTYPDLLEKKLNRQAGRRGMKRSTVLNAGIGNSNTSMQLARYKRHVRPLRPDWVVVGFFINDAEPDPVPNRNPVLRHSALAALLVGQLRVRVGGPYREYLTYYRSLYGDSNPGWPRLQEVLKEFGQLLQQDKIPATILLLPEMHQPKDFGPFADIYGRIASIAGGNGFEVIDASRRFATGPGRDYWVSGDDAHPNAVAHEIFAAALANSRYASAAVGN